MKSADQTPSTAAQIQRKSASSFFGNTTEQEPPFFAAKETANTGGFFSPAAPLSKNSPIQAKLTVGAPNDKYEQEADIMADKVVQRLSQSETIQTKATPSVSAPIVMKTAVEEDKLQKKEEEKQPEETPELQKSPVSAVGDDEGLQMKCADCEAEDKKHVQRKESGETAASPSIESRLSATKGGGSPMSNETQSGMESAFGADFSGVRVHTGSEAVQMSQDLNAHAFTHGSDVYFNSGKYNPSNTEGSKLLAHELTHTVQQGNTKSIQRTCDPRVASCLPDPAQEQALTDRFRRLARAIETDLAYLGIRIELRGEFPIVSRISDLLGGTSLPSTNQWDLATSLLIMALNHRAAGRTVLAIAKLEAAEIAQEQAHRSLSAYTNNSESGAGRAVRGLEITRDSSVIAIGVLSFPVTGGLTSAAALSTVYASGVQVVQQRQEVNLGLRDHVDWLGITVNAAVSFLMNIGFGRLMGALAVRFPNLGQTAISRAITNILIGRTSAVGQVIVNTALNSARWQNINWEQFIDAVAQQFTLTDILRDAVVGEVAHQVNVRNPPPQTPPPIVDRRPNATVYNFADYQNRRTTTAQARSEQPSRSSMPRTDGSSALAYNPEPLPVEPIFTPMQPANDNVPMPLPVPILQSPHSGVGTTSPSSISPTSGVVAGTAAQQAATSTHTPQLQIRLVLPPQKARYLSDYRVLLGLLVARTDRPRKQNPTSQVVQWDENIRNEMPTETRNWGKQSLERRLYDDTNITRPIWSKRRLLSERMEVDHKIEWQVRPRNTTWLDQPFNFELLEARANASSGSVISHNIVAERNRLANLTGDSAWLDRELVFTEVVVLDGGDTSERWQEPEISRGEHFASLESHIP